MEDNEDDAGEEEDDDQEDYDLGRNSYNIHLYINTNSYI